MSESPGGENKAGSADSYTWDIFIAHSTRDRATADALFNHLDQRTRVFLAHERLQLGDEWDIEIAEAQRSSRVTVVIVSEATERAYYERVEIASAIAMARRNEERHRVVPLFSSAQVEADRVPYGLGLKEGLVLSPELTLEAAADRLLDLLAQLSVESVDRERAPHAFAGQITGSGCLLQPGPEWISPVRSNPSRFKLVAFDWDGTLLRGPNFTFSWESVWRYLAFDDSVQAELKREYRKQISADPSRISRVNAYRTWCRKARELFETRNLTRDQLRGVVADLSLTRNCRKAMAELRKAGVCIVIISGGLETFVSASLTDFPAYVDFLFMNRLEFDAEGKLTGVEATEYDFEGKAEALELACARAGCATSEAVFVGDRFNDEAVMLKVGRAIAYPPGDDVVRTVAHASVVEDDLMEVVPLILEG